MAELKDTVVNGSLSVNGNQTISNNLTAMAISEGGITLSSKYSPISHTQTASTITDLSMSNTSSSSTINIGGSQIIFSYDVGTLSITTS